MRPEKEIEKFLSDLFDEPSFNRGYCTPDIMTGIISFQLKMTRESHSLHQYGPFIGCQGGDVGQPRHFVLELFLY